MRDTRQCEYASATGRQQAGTYLEKQGRVLGFNDAADFLEDQKSKQNASPNEHSHQKHSVFFAGGGWWRGVHGVWFAALASAISWSYTEN